MVSYFDVFGHVHFEVSISNLLCLLSFQISILKLNCRICRMCLCSIDRHQRHEIKTRGTLFREKNQSIQKFWSCIFNICQRRKEDFGTHLIEIRLGPAFNQKLFS